MNILFVHRGFPGQYKYLIAFLASKPTNTVMFITEQENAEIANVRKFVYKVDDNVPKSKNPRLTHFEEDIKHAHAVAKVAMAIKEQGFRPDIIIGHTWGTTAFIKEVFPDVPLLCYFEWFSNAEGGVIGFDGVAPHQLYREKIKCDNSRYLMDLYSCDAGVTPTIWQRDQYPKEFHDKIKIIHDGIYTDICTPNKDAKFILRDKNIELTADDEVITYATRGMEPIRGFPQFMEAMAKLQKKRPNAHFIIAGTNEVFYGLKSKEGTYKDVMLRKLQLDMSKIHFVNFLPFQEYLNLLRVSSVHVYLTYPFILSWSILEAMSVGCCVVASDTKPVLEVIQDNYNGLLTDFHDVDKLVEKVEYALDNKEKMEEIRANARKTIVEKYSLSAMLPKHLEYIESTIRKVKEKK